MWYTITEINIFHLQIKRIINKIKHTIDPKSNNKLISINF